MRKFFSICLFLAVLASCQKKAEFIADTEDSSNTERKEEKSSLSQKFENDFFAGQLNREGGVRKSISATISLELIPIILKRPVNVFAYALYQSTNNGDAVFVRYVASRTKLTSNVLSSKLLGQKYYRLIDVNNTAKQSKSVLFPAVSGARMTVTDTTSSGSNTNGNISTNDNGNGPNCIDWYWISYDAATGVILDQVFVGTTCVDENDNPSDGGDPGGGGAGGGDDGYGTTAQVNVTVEESEPAEADDPSQGNGPKPIQYLCKGHFTIWNSSYQGAVITGAIIENAKVSPILDSWNNMYGQLINRTIGTMDNINWEVIAADYKSGVIHWTFYLNSYRKNTFTNISNTSQTFKHFTKFGTI